MWIGFVTLLQGTNIPIFAKGKPGLFPKLDRIIVSTGSAPFYHLLAVQRCEPWRAERGRQFD